MMPTLKIKDIQCRDCIRCKEFIDGNLYCTRLNQDCRKARNYCVKSRWYAQLCLMSASLDYELSKRVNGNAN